MAKAKGSPKTGGRKKGSRNKMTVEIKEVINKLVNCINNDLDEIYNGVKEDQKNVLVNFLGKIAPKDLNIKAEVKSSPMSEEIKKLREQYVKSNINTTVD
jgi:hypothetical protein